MKYLLFLLIGLSTPVMAQQGITNVHEVAASTQTLIQTIDLDWGLTNMGTAISSGNVAGYFAIEVYNLAANADTIVCGFDASLSSATSSVWYGREVARGEGVYWAVPSYRVLNCRNTRAAGVSSRVTVSLFK